MLLGCITGGKIKTRETIVLHADTKWVQ